MYRRPYYRSRRQKYSNETVSVSTEILETINPGDQFPVNANPNPDLGQIPKGLLVVPATTLLGNRKVKNFTIKITSQFSNAPILGALIYVPEGTTPSNLSIMAANQSMYEPNQNVIASFIIPPSCNRDANGAVSQVLSNPTTTVSSRLARNLSSGDSIVLLFTPYYSVPAGDGTGGKMPLYINGTINFAIKY